MVGRPPSRLFDAHVSYLRRWMGVSVLDHGGARSPGAARGVAGTSPTASLSLQVLPVVTSPRLRPKSGSPDFGHPIEWSKSETSDFDGEVGSR